MILLWNWLKKLVASPPKVRGTGVTKNPDGTIKRNIKRSIPVRRLVLTGRDVGQDLMVTIRQATGLRAGGTTVAATIADVVAPTVPTGLQATAVSSSQINLSWNASTDNSGVMQSGVAVYRIRRGGMFLADVNAPTLTYSNTGLSPSTNYSYTVAARDAAGNESAQSGSANATTQSGSSVFPLSISSNGRYLQNVAGTPFLVHGDTCWSIVGQLTNAQIDTYLNDRAAKGVNTIIFSAPEAFYTNQTPAYNNVDGVAPFSPATSFTNPVEAYWSRVDYLVNGALSRNILCVINPGYWGYQGNDGWGQYLTGISNTVLQNYGAFLGNRYGQPNIMWCAGGDEDGAANISKQWNIMLGIRSVRTTNLITAHPLADGSNADDAYTYWNGYAGFNVNWIYGYEGNGFFVPTLAAQGYTRPIPFVGMEFQYEQEPNPPVSALQLRRQSYSSNTSGACGQVFGNNPIWHFQSSRSLYPYSGTWQSNLGSTGSQQQVHVKNLFTAYEWWKLEPRTNTSLVSSSLGSGTGRICPARASDGSFAMIYVPVSATVTVVMSALTIGSIRARLYDPSTGTYSTVPGSPFPNTGTQNIATGGERVIVLDASASAITETSLWPNGQVVAASASQADVQAAVNAATAGQRVLIPNGSATWTTGVNVGSKNILIRAQNYTPTSGGTLTRNVTITNNNTGGPLFSFTSGNTYHCGLAGIRFNEGTGNTPYVHMSGSGSKVPLLWDIGCQTRARFGSTEATSVIVWLARGGVCWNSMFDGSAFPDSGSDVGNAISGGCWHLKSPNRVWTTASTLGTLDTNGDVNVYIEDCTWRNTASNDADDHTRVVVRYCTLDGSPWITHGFTSSWGGRFIEFYNNTFSVLSGPRNMAGRYVWFRAGHGVFTDNVVNQASDLSYGSINFFVCAIESGTLNMTWDGSSWPKPRQVGCGHNGTSYVSDPIYFWSNTGARATAISGTSDTPGVQIGRDLITSGAAKPGYTKYAYPHPLRPT